MPVQISFFLSMQVAALIALLARIFAPGLEIPALAEFQLFARLIVLLYPPSLLGCEDLIGVCDGKEVANLPTQHRIDRGFRLPLRKRVRP